MVHLYALTEHPAYLPDVRGIGAAPLATAAVGAIDAIFSEIGGDPTEPTEASILAHAHVVEEVARINDAVLPARLARPFENEPALLARIRDRDVQFRAALDRVRGCVEMGVRVLQQTNGDQESTPSGSQYMRSRLDAVKLAETIADELDEAVSGLTRDTLDGITGTGELVLTAAYLLPREDGGRFRAAVETVATGHPDLSYVCVGPWPPYSFALVDGGAS
jgi:Gas vesicle synthesis protein GvpL/GvpF